MDVLGARFPDRKRNKRRGFSLRVQQDLAQQSANHRTSGPHAEAGAAVSIHFPLIGVIPMSNRLRSVPALAILGLLLAAPVHADTLEAVEKKLAEQSRKTTSLSMKMKTVSDVSGEGFKSITTIDGTYEYMTDGKKTLTRIDVSTKTQMELGGTRQNIDAKSLTISDGEVMWMLSEQSGQKMVSKMKADEKQMTNWREDMKEWYNLKLLPDETVDGKPCYVIEMTPKKAPAAAAEYRTVQYYQKDTGVVVKAVSYGADRKPVSTTTYSDIKINPKLDKGRFTFTPPAGVPVMDMTQNAGFNSSGG
ncbi:MAG: hypothetical protein DCC66_12495 [Planctomycetota bacterium]|nr:MAG: hypothetical protein DCC66_12495 [Planctomycetota bacterium]